MSEWTPHSDRSGAPFLVAASNHGGRPGSSVPPLAALGRVRVCPQASGSHRSGARPRAGEPARLDQLDDFKSEDTKEAHQPLTPRENTSPGVTAVTVPRAVPRNPAAESLFLPAGLLAPRPDF